MICGRCGGRMYYDGYMLTVWYFTCSECGNVIAEEDVYAYMENPSLLHNNSALILKSSAKAQFANAGGVKKKLWQKSLKWQRTASRFHA